MVNKGNTHADTSRCISAAVESLYSHREYHSCLPPLPSTSPEETVPPLNLFCLNLDNQKRPELKHPCVAGG